MALEKIISGGQTGVDRAALDAALEVWEGVDLAALRARSIALSESFVTALEGREDLVLASPRDPQRRGSQVS